MFSELLKKFALRIGKKIIGKIILTQAFFSRAFNSTAGKTSAHAPAGDGEGHEIRLKAS